MKFDKWVQDYKGKKIDYDGVYGVQCVDLIKHYIDKVIGKKPQSIGNAKDYWSKRNQKYLKSMFVPIKNTAKFIPRKGDIFVRSSGKYGHIGVCDGDSTTEYFRSWEENAGGTGEGMTKHRHTNWATINFLRPRYQYVDANGGLRGYKKLKSKSHAVTIKDGAKVEIIKANCGKKTIKKKSYQMQQVKYSGKKYYVADEFFMVGK